MNKRHAVVLMSALAAASSEPVLAYVGPGAGLSLIGALWGLVAAIFVALGFVIIWPIRRMRRQRASGHRDTKDGSTRKEDRSLEDGRGREAS